MQNSLISVIIPVYNVEKYLDKCVQSVVNQTYKNLEIILVDDGSPDSSGSLCDKWAKKDSRVKVIHKPNGGVSSARNCGIEDSDGEYIAFIDSDDYIDADMYEIMLKEIVEFDADAARCAVVRESENGYTENWGDYNAEPFVVDNKKLLADIGEAIGILPVHVGNKLFKRSVIGDVRFDSRFKYAEDTLFNFTVAMNINKIVYHDIPRYHYNNNADSVAHMVFNENKFDEHRVMDIIFTLADSDTLPHCIKGDVYKSFRTIKEMCESGNCTDRFSEIRYRIISHKNEIFKSNLYSAPNKFKTLFIWLLPDIYKVFIKYYARNSYKKFKKLTDV